MKMKRWILTLLTVAIIVVAPVVLKTTLADDLENEAACQQCLNNADARWQQCIAMVGGDEGDWACADARTNAKLECQREVCID